MPRRTSTLFGVLVVLVAAVVGTVLGLSAGNGRASRASRPSRPPAAHPTGSTVARRSAPTPATSVRAGTVVFASPRAGASPGPNLAAGSDPSALPADVLIADRSNGRLLVVSPTGQVVWRFPRPGDLAPGQTFGIPNGAFFSPSGKEIVATEEGDQVVTVIDVATHRILWRYGTPGSSGGGPGHLANPDDAMVLPDGDVVAADIKNCSIVFLKPGDAVPVARIGVDTPYCYHAPPERFGSPNGAFPLRDGDLLVTETNGDWVDELTPSGQVRWSTHPPGVRDPSGTNEVAPGRYLTADATRPGQAVELDAQGTLLWRYGPASGPGMLDQPSLCVPVPTNGDVLCTDDGNDRVVVIDPRTDRIVWQYGHTGVPGTAPGYLRQPAGVDLVPPYSLAVRLAPTMVTPPTACVSTAPPGTCTFGPAAAVSAAGTSGAASTSG